VVISDNYSVAVYQVMVATVKLTHLVQ